MSGSAEYRASNGIRSGEVRVPAEALYGAQTQRAVENFPDLRSAPLAGLHLVDGDDQARRRRSQPRPRPARPGQAAEAIARAAEEVRRGRWDEQFVVDPFQAGAGTSHNMNANEVIANRATQLLGGRAGRVPRPSQRSRQHGAVDQRHHPHRHPPGMPVAAGRAAAGAWAGWRWRCSARPPNSIRSSSPAGRTCRTPCRSAWARNSAAMRRRWRAMPSGSAGRPMDCAGWGSAGRPSGTGLNAHPEYRARMVAAAERAGRARAPGLATTCSRACSRWPTWPTSRPRCAPWR